jgi:hypothetical protein
MGRFLSWEVGTKKETSLARPDLSLARGVKEMRVGGEGEGLEVVEGKGRLRRD